MVAGSLRQFLRTAMLSVSSVEEAQHLFGLMLLSSLFALSSLNSFLNSIFYCSIFFS